VNIHSRASYVSVGHSFASVFCVRACVRASVCVSVGTTPTCTHAPTHYKLFFYYAHVLVFVRVHVHVRLRVRAKNLSPKYGVASSGRLLEIIGLLWKRDLEKRLYSAKETYDFEEPTNRSHPIQTRLISSKLE